MSYKFKGKIEEYIKLISLEDIKESFEEYGFEVTLKTEEDQSELEGKRMNNHFDKLSAHDKIDVLVSILSINGFIRDEEIEALSEAIYNESVKRAEETDKSIEEKNL